LVNHFNFSSGQSAAVKGKLVNTSKKTMTHVGPGADRWRVDKSKTRIVSWCGIANPIEKEHDGLIAFGDCHMVEAGVEQECG
jgi:hypothetical protein